MTDRALIARYPFLPGSDGLLGDLRPSLRDLLEDPGFEPARALAREELEAAVLARREERPRALEAFDAAVPEVRVLAFLYMRMLVAAAPAPQALARRWGEGEARRAGAALERGPGGADELVEVAHALELGARAAPGGRGPVVFSLPSYVQLASGLREERFRLAQQNLAHGEVAVERGVGIELLQQGIREYLQDEVALLPLEPELREGLRSREAEVLRRLAALIPTTGPGGFGAEVHPELFPPCMREVRSRLAGGGNVSHHGRFALASFMHKVGSDIDAIVEAYRGAGNFNEGITRYQVTQIAHHDGGSGYTPPDCATLIANGLCFREKDEARPSLCADPVRLKNPLNYYRYRLRGAPTGRPHATGSAAGAGGERATGQGAPAPDGSGAPSTSPGPASRPSPAPAERRPPEGHPSA